MKQRLGRLIIALTLLLALNSAITVVADELGLELSAPVFACQEGSGTGGC